MFCIKALATIDDNPNNLRHSLSKLYELLATVCPHYLSKNEGGMFKLTWSSRSTRRCDSPGVKLTIIEGRRSNLASCRTSRCKKWAGLWSNGPFRVCSTRNMGNSAGHKTEGFFPRLTWPMYNPPSVKISMEPWLLYLSKKTILRMAIIKQFSMRMLL